MNDIDKRLEEIISEVTPQEVEVYNEDTDKYENQELVMLIAEDYKFLIDTLNVEREEKERLEKALEFYADEDTYYLSNKWSPIEKDGGEKARSALGGDRE